MERKKERESEGGEKGRIEGGGGRREKERHTAEIKICTDLLGCGHPDRIMEARR